MLFLKILLTEFIAEMGDKTQLMLVAMTSRYKVKDIVLGTAAAVLVLNGLAVLAGGLVSEFVPDWLIKLIAGAAFLFFALTSLKKDDDEEEAEGKGKFKVAAIAVFCTFFVAELGDKTQLTAITFGANEGMEKAIIVWLACSIGLFAADMVGMAVGLLVKNKMSTGFLNVLAYVIFAIFGVLTLKTGFELLLNGEYLIPITVAIIAIFIILSVIIYFIENKKEKKTSEELK
ncbi:MAG: TMEM165/GDT1 family protein [Lachnospiraceae bacterium]|nr:TMEM165/GDT1 family protein [Lachnospiraceae bacterium]